MAAKWLAEAALGAKTQVIAADDGDLVFSINGQSQASRRSPKLEASRWLGQQDCDFIFQKKSVCLFGLGNPWLAILLLQQDRSLMVFEANVQLLKAVFENYDLSVYLKTPEKGLHLITPYHLAHDDFGQLDYIMVHPPSQRREAAHHANLEKFLSSPLPSLSPLSKEPLRIMVIPPLSGGSLPISVSLGQAINQSSHKLLFLQWPPHLVELEKQAHTAPALEAAKLTNRLFAETMPVAAQACETFQPHLIVALAQAPLEVKALKCLREKSDALIVFWLVEDFKNFSYLAHVAPAYDALFHIQPGVIDKTLKTWGIRQNFYLPMAADASLFKPLSQGEISKNPYGAKLSFMGAGYPNRRRIFSTLTETYWPQTKLKAKSFRIFGSGWAGSGSGINKHLFENGRRISLPECAMIYASTLINLNIHSSFVTSGNFDPESGFVNPRTFEIAASGALQVVDERPLLPPLFEAGHELITAAHPKQLPEIIDYYLKNP
ncbi:MAG: CgeB family protein, partial [Candidatus Adiutrix sp.]